MTEKQDLIQKLVTAGKMLWSGKNPDRSSRTMLLPSGETQKILKHFEPKDHEIGRFSDGNNEVIIRLLWDGRRKRFKLNVTVPKPAKDLDLIRLWLSENL